MLKQLRHLIFIGLFSTLLAACGGGGGTAGTSAPTINSTSPANSATAVARNSSITATFDDDIFAITVDAASFILKESGADNISGIVSFNGATNVASFTPDNELAMLTDYTATLSAVITDLNGNALAENYSWSFTTADGTWNNAERIETNVGDAGNLQIAFDSSGKAFVVWAQNSDDSRKSIWINRFDGSRWGSAELIETNRWDASAPQIAVDSSSKAFAVWTQSDGSNYSVWTNRFK